MEKDRDRKKNEESLRIENEKRAKENAGQCIVQYNAFLDKGFDKKEAIQLTSQVFNANLQIQSQIYLQGYLQSAMQQQPNPTPNHAVWTPVK